MPPLLALVTALAVACDRSRPAGNGAGTSDCPALSGVQLGAHLYERLLEAGGTRAQVRARLGAPPHATAAGVPNRHVPGQLDTLVRWTYEASSYEFLLVLEHEFLLQRRAQPTHPAIGECATRLATPEAAMAALGPATWTDTRTDTTILGYEIRLEEAPVYDVLALHYAAGGLVAVAAIPYVD